jgi:hypothetical protein
MNTGDTLQTVHMTYLQLHRPKVVRGRVLRVLLWYRQAWKGVRESSERMERPANLSPTCSYNGETRLISIFKSLQLGESSLAPLIFSRIVSHATENGLLSELLKKKHVRNANKMLKREVVWDKPLSYLDLSALLRPRVKWGVHCR